jgi:Na+-transporting methylmalonyl-CoA/oxaloacetate decarboxylase beta subunit
LEEQVLVVAVVVALRQPQPQALYPQSRKMKQRLLPMRQLRLVRKQSAGHRLDPLVVVLLLPVLLPQKIITVVGLIMSLLLKEVKV